MYSCFLFFSLLHSLSVYGYPQEKELHQHLFANYSKRVFPSHTVGHPVNVSIDSVMNYVIGLNEKTQVLTSDLQLIVSWRDNKLVWEEFQFGGIQDILVPVHQIWIPDLSFQNALTERRRLAKDDQLVKITSDGGVEWVPDFVGDSLCPLSMTDYPFDTQTCTFFIESFSHGSDKVMIVAVSAPSISDVFPNGQWELLDTSSEITREDSGDSVALISIHIKRRRMHYLITIILPIVVTSSLNPFVFLLPTDSGEKVALSTTMLLCYSVMLTYIYDNIPAISLNIPLLGLFVGGQLVLSALSLVFTVVMLHFMKKEQAINDNEVDQRNEKDTEKYRNLKARFFRRLNTMLFGLFSVTEVTICLAIFMIIQS